VAALLKKGVNANAPNKVISRFFGIELFVTHIHTLMYENKHAYIHKKEGRLAEDLAREGVHTAIVALFERVQAIYQVQKMKDASIQDNCLNLFFSLTLSAAVA